MYRRLHASSQNNRLSQNSRQTENEEVKEEFNKYANAVLGVQTSLTLSNSSEETNTCSNGSGDSLRNCITVMNVQNDGFVDVNLDREERRSPVY